MKWRTINPWLIESNAGYRIARFVTGSTELFRASLNGEFIAPHRDTSKAARTDCEQHIKTV